MEAAFLVDMGRRIRERRKTLRLSQEELAERANISKQTVSRAENAQRELGAGNLIKIAQALDVSSDYLLTGIYTGADIQLLNHKTANLTSHQYSYLKDFVNKFVEMCDEGII